VIVEQVTNGVSVRMAVLYLLLGGSESAIGLEPPVDDVSESEGGGA
jgi:aspartate carbamoyltransferase catalytic subunit